jgi:hypothetical protein
MERHLLIALIKAQAVGLRREEATSTSVVD